MAAVILECMDISVKVLGKQAPRWRGVEPEVYVAVWKEAEDLYVRATDPASRDYLEGVVTTLRWLAALDHDTVIRLGVPSNEAPSGQPRSLLPEEVEKEISQAQNRRARERRAGRTGDYAHGVAETFAWLRSIGGRPPVDEQYRMLFDALND